MQRNSEPDCPDGPFETELDKISEQLPLQTPPVRSLQDANAVVPIEISRVLEGGVSFFRGGLMNEGVLSWYGFDIERRLFVAVLCSSGDRARHVPVVERLTVNQLLRYTDAGGYRRAEFVTVADATPQHVRAFGCLANRLLATESEVHARPLPADTMTRSFSLLHEGRPLDLGGGRKRWASEGQLERFIKETLQEPIRQALQS